MNERSDGWLPLLEVSRKAQSVGNRFSKAN